MQHYPTFLLQSKNNFTSRASYNCTFRFSSTLGALGQQLVVAFLVHCSLTSWKKICSWKICPFFWKLRQVFIVTLTLVSLLSKAPEIIGKDKKRFLKNTPTLHHYREHTHQRKSLQKAQKVGCRKNLATSLCPRTTCTLWCLTAPRRRVMGLPAPAPLVSATMSRRGTRVL